MINHKVDNYQSFAKRITEILGHNPFLLKFNRHRVKVSICTNIDKKNNEGTQIR